MMELAKRNEKPWSQLNGGRERKSSCSRFNLLAESEEKVECKGGQTYKAVGVSLFSSPIVQRHGGKKEVHEHRHWKRKRRRNQMRAEKGTQKNRILILNARGQRGSMNP